MTQTVVAAALIFQWVGKSGASKRQPLNAAGNFGTRLQDSCLIEPIFAPASRSQMADVAFPYLLPAIIGLVLRKPLVVRRKIQCDAPPFYRLIDQSQIRTS